MTNSSPSPATSKETSMPEHTLPTPVTLNPALTQRYSPYEFDPDRPVAEGDIEALLEAARWAMSCFNEQPWRYVIATRDAEPDRWEKILACLVEGNQAWARFAPVLALGCVVDTFARNGKPNAHATHDLGAASALLTVEAVSRGLQVHQMAGILPDTAVDTFGLPEGCRAVTALAIGYTGHNPKLDDSFRERERKPRERRPVADFLVGR
jgi:nitroreductase